MVGIDQIKALFVTKIRLFGFGEYELFVFCVINRRDSGMCVRPLGDAIVTTYHQFQSHLGFSMTDLTSVHLCDSAVNPFQATSVANVYLVLNTCIQKLYGMGVLHRRT